MSDAERRQLEIQTLEARVAMLHEAAQNMLDNTEQIARITKSGVPPGWTALRAALAATSEGVAQWRGEIEAKVRDETEAFLHAQLAMVSCNDEVIGEHDARVRKAALEEAFHAAAEAKLPVWYRWGRDAMESFHVGTRQAAQAIRALASPAPAPATSPQVHPPGQPGDIATDGASSDGRPGLPHAAQEGAGCGVHTAQEGAAATETKRCPFVSRAYGGQCEKQAGHDGLCVSLGDGFHGGPDCAAPVCATCGNGMEIGDEVHDVWAPCPDCTKPEGGR